MLFQFSLCPLTSLALCGQRSHIFYGEPLVLFFSEEYGVINLILYVSLLVLFLITVPWITYRFLDPILLASFPAR